MDKTLLNPDITWSAQALLDKYGLTQPPIDVYALAEQLNLIVSDEFDFDQMGIAGKIKWSADRETAEIWVNPLDSGERRRFTLSHELGHLFKHMIPNRLDREKDESFVDNPSHFRDGRRNSKEQEANQFAAELLMPAKMLREHAKKLADANRDPETRKIQMTRDDFIKSLAETFGVSPLAMEYRLKNLRIL
jgi:Zn-dependent peptidase ImmA (M78 family)